MAELAGDTTTAATAAPTTVKPAPSDSTPLLDYSDASYLAEITMGTPGQKFKVLMDTASADLWVPSSGCTTCICNGKPPTCYSKAGFNSNTSTSFFHIGTAADMSYFLGNCSGTTERDTLTIAGISVPEQKFASVTKMDASFQQEPLDGMFGLGYQEISWQGVVPPVQNMFNKGLIPKNMFSVWMQIDAAYGRSDGGEAGEILFGGYDDDKYTGKITYYDVMAGYLWQLNMTQLQVGTTTIGKGPYKAISVTSSPYIVLPDTQFAAFIAKLIIDNVLKVSIFHPSTKTFHLKSCGNATLDKASDLVFTFGNENYHVQAYDYAAEVNGKDCLLRVQSRSNAKAVPKGIDIVLGEPFIRAWYHVFDFDSKKVGLAKAYRSFVERGAGNRAVAGGSLLMAASVIAVAIANVARR